MSDQKAVAASQTTEQTQEALKKLLGAFASADIDKLAGCYDDNIDWLFLAPSMVFPFAGVRRTKAEVVEGFRILFKSYTFSDYRAEAIVCDGDRAATLSNGQMVQRTTGRLIRIRTANFYRFAGQKAVEYRGFTDSLDIVEQVLGRELDY